MTGFSKIGDNSTDTSGVGDTVGSKVVPSSLCVGEEAVNAAVAIKVLLGWSSEIFADICVNGEMGPSPETGVGEGEGEGFAKSEVFASAMHTAYVYRQSKKNGVCDFDRCVHIPIATTTSSSLILHAINTV